jgi:hypothetical protein
MSMRPHVYQPVKIKHIEMDGEDGILVTFSDGTSTGYVAEELLDLRPKRERVVDPSD